MKKALICMFLICCTAVGYSSSVSSMMPAPNVNPVNTEELAPIDNIYGEPQTTGGKVPFDGSLSALSGSYQQGGTTPSAPVIDYGKATVGDFESGNDPGPSPSVPQTVPEPNTLLLGILGLAGLGILILRRN